MKTNIFIPTKINVGFQNRSGTYTGKLAYVIYYDEKGKLRKETSWQNWRDEKIPNEIFENEPTEGFVLNKKVGGTRYSWNPRQTYTRVYDPRGFEFEITVPNLLWILENCNCIKGKGVQGQFVYGWDGKELVLVPVDSPDYQEIQKRNKIIHNNEFIKAKDLILGATYETLNGVRLVYLGRFPHYIIERNYHLCHVLKAGYEHPVDNTWHENIDVGNYKNILYRSIIDKPKVFWFMELGNPNSKYNYEKGNHIIYFSTLTKKIATVLDTNCHTDFIQFIEQLNKCEEFSPIDFTSNKIIDLPFENFQHICWQTIEKSTNSSTNPYYHHKFSIGIRIDDKHLEHKEIYYNHYENKFYYEVTVIEDCWRGKTVNVKMFDSIKELYQDLKPVYGEQFLENGQLYERSYYYGTEK